jgi:nucleotide-binding universal stress UspA family protein
MNASPIVCATDLSEVSRAALRQARALARWEGCDLHVVHVGPGPEAGSRARRAAVDGDGFRSPGPDAPERETFVARRGHPAEAVIAYAGEVRAQLIVVGTALPRASVSHRESIGETIARSAICPTLVVPTGRQVTHDDLPFRTIVCAVDFSPGSMAAFGQAIDLAQSAGGALTLVHVLDEFDGGPARVQYVVPEYRHRRLLEAYHRLSRLIPPQARDWADIDVQVLPGDAAERILALAQGLRSDLIVMGVTPRSRLSRLLSGSASHRVTVESACPVLVVGSPAAAAAWSAAHPVIDRRSQMPPVAFTPDYVAKAAGRGAADAAGLAGLQQATRLDPGVHRPGLEPAPHAAHDREVMQ